MTKKLLDKAEYEVKPQGKEEVLWVMRLLLSQFSSVNNAIETIMISEGNPFLFALETAPNVLGRWLLTKKLNKWVKDQESLIKALGKDYDIEKPSPLSELVKMIPPEEYLDVDPKTMKLLKFFDVDITKFQQWKKKYF